MNKIKEMKTSELIDNYKEVTDEQSIPFMDEFWDRFPFDTLVYDKEETEKAIKDLRVRLRHAEELIKDDARIIRHLEKNNEIMLRVCRSLEKIAKKY